MPRRCPPGASSGRIDRAEGPRTANAPLLGGALRRCTVSVPLSDTQERLRDAWNEGAESQRRVGRGETNAIRAGLGHRGVVQILVRDFDVPRSETIHLVGERALQNE